MVSFSSRSFISAFAAAAFSPDSFRHIPAAGVPVVTTLCANSSLSFFFIERENALRIPGLCCLGYVGLSAVLRLSGPLLWLPLLPL